MVKETQTIRRKIADHLNVFDHFVGLVLKGLKYLRNFSAILIQTCLILIVLELR